MKKIFAGCVAASFLVVSCSGGDDAVSAKDDSPAVESAPAVEPATSEDTAVDNARKSALMKRLVGEHNARKSALMNQLVGDYTGMATVSDESRERVLVAVGNTDLLDERLASMVVDMEMRADGTCTYTWTLGDEPLINEGTWVFTTNLAHVTISMEGIPEGYFLKMGVFSMEREVDYAISDDKKTLSYSLDSFGMETGQVFIRK